MLKGSWIGEVQVLLTEILLKAHGKNLNQLRMLDVPRFFRVQRAGLALMEGIGRKVRRSGHISFFFILLINITLAKSRPVLCAE